MKKQNIAMVIGAVLVGLLSSVVSAQGVDYSEQLISETNGVQLWSVPVDIEALADNLLATRVEVRSANPDATDIVTFDGISITGDLHQVGIPGLFGTTPTPKIDIFGNAPEWAAFDSHFAIPEAWVQGGAGGAYTMSETNDESNALGINERAPLLQGTVAAVSGIGQLSSADPSDAFFIGGDANKDVVPFAYLVVAKPENFGGAAAAGPILANLEMNVLGDGFDPIAVNVGVPFAQGVPEPSTGVLAGVFGLAVLAYRRRRNG